MMRLHRSHLLCLIAALVLMPFEALLHQVQAHALQPASAHHKAGLPVDETVCLECQVFAAQADGLLPSAPSLPPLCGQTPQCFRPTAAIPALEAAVFRARGPPAAGKRSA